MNGIGFTPQQAADWWNSQAAAEMATIAKDVAGVTSGGQATLFREDLSGVMPLMAPAELPPLTERFRRVKGNGTAHSWKRLIATQPAGTGMPFIAGTTPVGALGGFFPVGGLPTSVLPTYDTVAVAYKNVGHLITVAWQTQASGMTYTDISAHQRRVGIIHTRQLEEWCICNGNATANALQFDGLDVYITNTLNVANVKWGLYEAIVTASERVSYNGGMSRCVVYPYPAHSFLQKLITEVAFPAAGQMQQLSTGMGFNIPKWNFGWGYLDLIPERYLAETAYGWPVYVLDDQTPDGENNGNTIEMVDLIPLEQAQLATLLTAERHIVHESTVLKVTCPNFQYKLYCPHDYFNMTGLDTMNTHVV